MNLSTNVQLRNEKYAQSVEITIYKLYYSYVHFGDGVKNQSTL